MRSIKNVLLKNLYSSILYDFIANLVLSKKKFMKKQKYFHINFIKLIIEKYNKFSKHPIVFIQIININLKLKK